jgi:hypothetical protein
MAKAGAKGSTERLALSRLRGLVTTLYIIAGAPPTSQARGRQKQVFAQKQVFR